MCVGGGRECRDPRPPERVGSLLPLSGRVSCTLRCFFGSNLFVCLDRGSHCFTEVWLKAMIPLSQSPKHQDCSTTHFHASTVENASQPHCGVRGLWEQQRGTHVREPGLWSCVNRRQTGETRIFRRRRVEACAWSVGKTSAAFRSLALVSCLGKAQYLLI